MTQLWAVSISSIPTRTTILFLTLAIPSSVRRYHAVVSGSLEYAYKLGIIPENPAKRAELPAASHHNIGAAYTAEEAQQLLNALVGSKIFPAIFLTLYYGLRREEVLGLTWSAINFDAGTIKIC